MVDRVGGFRVLAGGITLLSLAAMALSGAQNYAMLLGAAAVAGLGVVSTGYWGSRQELEDGRLVPVLPDWRREPVELNAVYAAGRAAKPAARLFTDFLIEALNPMSP